MLLSEIMQDHGFMKGEVLIIDMNGDPQFLSNYKFLGVWGFRNEALANKFHEFLQEKYEDNAYMFIEIHKCEEGLVIPAWIVTLTEQFLVSDDLTFFAVGDSEAQIKEDFEDEIPTFLYENKILEECAQYVKLDTEVHPTR